MPILFDRSRVTADWKCPRSRYLGYEYKGRGLSTTVEDLALFVGSTLHTGLADITRGVKGIDEVANEAATTTKAFIFTLMEGEPESTTSAHEQASLVEGLLRGFDKHQWPKLRAQYPEILMIEPELNLELPGGLTFMSRPDLVVRDAGGLATYIEYKSTSSNKDQWINAWTTAVQLHSATRAIEKHLDEKGNSIVVQGLYKGFCLAPETPILTADLRWEQLGSLKVGDKLAGFEESSGNNRSGGKALRQWREAIVTKTGSHTLPCYEILLEDGTCFVCSDAHQWLTAAKAQGMGSAKWTATDRLVPNCSRIIKLIDPWTGTGEISAYDAGYLAAAFDGEGSICKMILKDQYGKDYNSLMLTFSQNPNQMLEHVKYLLDRYDVVYSGDRRKSERKIEAIQLYGKIKLLSFLGKVKPKRLLPKLNFNNLGMIKDLPRRPVLVISKVFLGRKEVTTLETTTGTFVANGFASHNSSYGKLSSPFVYAYVKKGNPPFTQDLVEYEYKQGYFRHPVWEREGGVKAWVEGMPETVLANQFPQTPPIFYKPEMIDAFFAQRTAREIEIALASEQIQQAGEESELGQHVLDDVFPQKFDACDPAYGKPCPFKRMCFGHVKEPLKAGWVVREPHHQLEREAYASPSKTY